MTVMMRTKIPPRNDTDEQMKNEGWSLAHKKKEVLQNGKK